METFGKEFRKFSEKGSPRVAPKDVKTGSTFVLSPIQRERGLSPTYPAPILTAFETKDVNRCPRVYTGEKFQISAQGFFKSPKRLKWVLLRDVCDKSYSSNGTISANGNRFGD